MTAFSVRMESVAGLPVRTVNDLNPAIPERIFAGRSGDVGLTNPPYVKQLVDAGLVDAATHRAFGRVRLAVARRAGHGGEVLGETAAIVDLLKAAPSIGYTGAGTSGRTYLGALSRLGIVETVAPQSRPMGGGAPVTAVAAGEIAFAVAPLTTILASPGVEPAAIFPDELGTHIDMSVFVTRQAMPEAMSVLEFLTSQDLDDELAAAGVSRFELA
ncbi:substrate-binding domain-containing protein [Salipiger pacificus]|uniref:Substrate-binding domain-containing protein n=2 Tax=Salipiger mangrovisoli TaxID=2865933 RepID=A0ABR9WYS7_9RHOB|nr:substrate-binding domain-containing protein [Salipiger mangrovisoli]